MDDSDRADEEARTQLVAAYFHKVRSASKKPRTPAQERLYEAAKARVMREGR